jgi:integrase
MAGQIIRRGDRTFLVRWHLGRGGDGRRRYASKTVHGTKKDAQAALREELRGRDLGITTTSRRMLLGDYLDRWLETAVATRLRKRTAEEYKLVLRRYVRPYLGGLRLDRVTPLEVQGMIRELDRRGLGPRTIRYAHAVLSGAMRQAVRWRMIAMNPASDVDLPRMKRREMAALSPAQADAFQAAIRGTPHEALFLTMLATGLRPAEALALRWQELDLTGGRLVVRRTLPERTRLAEMTDADFEEPKTARSRRVVPLPPSLVDVLKAHRARQAERRMELGPAYRADLDLVFASASGTPLARENTIRRHFKPALKRAGLSEKIRLYDLRHSFATLAMAAGVHVKHVAERMGHTSTTLTMDTYSHVLEPMEGEATARIEAVLFGGREVGTL